VPEIAPFIERKRWSVAFHYRALLAESRIQERLLDSIQVNLPRGLRLLRGKAVYEVRPDIDQDKGTALRWLVDRTRARRVLFGGDDTTDLPAFQALASMAQQDRLRVAVRSEGTPEELIACADLVVDDVAGFHALLQDLVIA
jgi:trehalose-phosphatase